VSRRTMYPCWGGIAGRRGVRMVSLNPALLITGQLVCFFPKQTVLPRIRGVSRSPSITRDMRAPPLLKAMSALSRLENPHQRRVRVKVGDSGIPLTIATATATRHYTTACTVWLDVDHPYIPERTFEGACKAVWGERGG
jgi:hypothetical protein